MHDLQESLLNKPHPAPTRGNFAAELCGGYSASKQSTLPKQRVPDRNRKGEYKAIAGCCPTCGAGLKSQQIQVDLDTNTLLIRGQCVYLRAKEAELLSVLVRRAPGVVTCDTLVARLWGVNEPIDAKKNIEVHICRLRRALKPVGAAIINIFNVGYRFEAGANHER